MYRWRQLSNEQRRELLRGRKLKARPWHSPPHQDSPGTNQFLISAACFEHAPIIGSSTNRMDEFSETLFSVLDANNARLLAWCVLPNHYHCVVQADGISDLLCELGKMHGRTSFEWNGQEHCRGRQVWFNLVERGMRSPRHLWASINYVHHNPVKHGYVTQWQDWVWSSATAFLNEVGPEQARIIWETYPILDYGKGWDD